MVKVVYQSPECFALQSESEPFALSFGANVPGVGGFGLGDFDDLNDGDEIDW